MILENQFYDICKTNVIRKGGGGGGDNIFLFFLFFLLWYK